MKKIHKIFKNMDRIQDIRYEIALKELNDRLDSYILLVKQGSMDLDHFKLTQPSEDMVLPASIFDSMNFFLQLHQKSVRGPQSLMNIILFSQLNTFSESDSEVTSLKDKKDEFIMLVVQLYMSIYGLTNRGMYGTILNAPEQTENPINHLVYILELYKYQSSSMYYQHIFEVLKLLEVVAQTIYLYDHIDHRHGIKRGYHTKENAKLSRDHQYERYPTFRPFFRDHLEPFVLSMENLNNIYMIFRNQDRWTADEKYRSEHGQEHLSRVKDLLYNTSQFLRNIEIIPNQIKGEITNDKINEKQKTLCIDIAFAIEVSIGLREPLNQLFKEAMPLMNQYIFNKRKAPDRWYMDVDSID